MVNRTPIKQNPKQSVRRQKSKQQFKSPADELDRRVQALMKRRKPVIRPAPVEAVAKFARSDFQKAEKLAGHGLTDKQQDHLRKWHAEYRETLNRVLSKDKALARAYAKPSARPNPLRDLESLATFLNSDDALDSALRSQLASELNPIVAWEKTTAESVKKAASLLARRLSALRAEWEPLFLGKKPIFAIGYPRNWYGVIARAIQEGNFRKLKLCRACNKFFVSADHRQTYCVDSCFRAHEAWRVKEWRTLTGN